MKVVWRYFVLGFCMVGVLSLSAALYADNPLLKQAPPRAQQEMALESTVRGTDWWPYVETAPYTSIQKKWDFDTIRVSGIIAINVNAPEKAIAHIPQELISTHKAGAGDQYYLVRFIGPVYQTYYDQLEKLGVTLHQTYQAFTRVAHIPDQAYDQVAALPCVKWVGVFHPAYRICPAIGTNLNTHQMVYNDDLTKKPFPLEVMVFQDQDLAIVKRLIDNLGGTIWDTVDAAHRKTLYIRIDPNKIVDLARIQGVKWIGEYVQPLVRGIGTREEHSVVFQNGSYVDAAASYVLYNAGIDGTGQIITVMDSGLATCSWWYGQTTGVCYTSGAGRIIVGYTAFGGGDLCACAGAYDSHGTIITSTTVGNISALGYTYYDWGMMHNGQVYFQDVGDLGTTSGSCSPGYVYPPADTTAAFNDAMSNGSWVHNDSWGSNSNTYTGYCIDADQAMLDNANFIVVTVAGNDGASSEDGTLDSFGSAKNILTAGGSDQDPNENFLYSDSTFIGSSRGPAVPLGSSRTKPDVIFTMYDDAGTAGNAAGELMAGVITDPTDADDQVCLGDTTPYAWYTTASYMGGTSFSSPMVAGACSLVREYFMDGFWPSGAATPADAFTPSNTLIKAAVIASAQNTSNVDNPNGNAVVRRYSSDVGYGRIQLAMGLEITAVDANREVLLYQDSVATGATDTYNLVVNCTTGDFKVVLVWNDTAQDAPQYDLDLSMTFGGSTYRGNYFGAGGWSATLGATADRTNNTEAIFIEDGTYSSGSAVITVDGYNAPSARNYSLYVVGCQVAEGVSVTFDNAVYDCIDTVGSTVNDTGGGASVNATITSLADSELVTCTGGPPIYSCATVQTTTAATGNNDGNLTIQDGETITITYTTETDNADIKCTWDLDLTAVLYTEGDGDGYIDCAAADGPGDITIQATAYNNDVYDAIGVVGTLSCISGCTGITITDNTVSYGDIAVGASDDGGTDTFAFNVLDTVPPGTDVTFEVDFAGTGWSGIPAAPDVSRQFTLQANLDNSASTLYDFETGFQGWTGATSPLSPNLSCTLTYQDTLWRLAPGSETGGTQSVVHNMGPLGVKQAVEDPSFTGNIAAPPTAATWRKWVSTTYADGDVIMSATADCDSVGQGAEFHSDSVADGEFHGALYGFLGDSDMSDMALAYRTFVPPETAHTIGFQWAKDYDPGSTPVYLDLYMNLYNGFDGVSTTDVLGSNLWANSVIGDFSCTTATVPWTTPNDFIVTEIDFDGWIFNGGSPARDHFIYVDDVTLTYTGTDYGTGIDAGLDSPTYAVPTTGGGLYGAKVGMYWYGDTFAGRSGGSGLAWGGATANVFVSDDAGSTWAELQPELPYIFSTATQTCNNPYDPPTGLFIGGDGQRGMVTGDTFSYEEFYDLGAYAGSNVNLRLRFGCSGCSVPDCSGADDYQGIIASTAGVYWDDVQFYDVVEDPLCVTATAPPPTPDTAAVPGTPFTVDKGTAGGTVDVTWDNTCGTQDDFNIYWGLGPAFDSIVDTQNCAIGTSGSVAGLTLADPPVGQFYWGVITAVGGTEFGRHGDDSVGTERSLTGDAAACGGTKNITETGCTKAMGKAGIQKDGQIWYPVKLNVSKKATDNVDKTTLPVSTPEARVFDDTRLK